MRKLYLRRLVLRRVACDIRLLKGRLEALLLWLCWRWRLLWCSPRKPSELGLKLSAGESRWLRLELRSSKFLKLGCIASCLRRETWL